MHRAPSPHRGHPSSHHSQRGISLIEALIGFLVLSLGLLSALRLQSALQLGADVSRQRSTAVRHAQQHIEQLRAAAASGPTAWGDTPAEPKNIAGSSTTYTVESDITESAAALQLTTLRVHWPDRSGNVQHAALHTAITASWPQHSAALALPHRPSALARPMGRAPGIPWDAQDLGDGRSAWKPSATSTHAWVFNPASGHITTLCTVAATQRTAHLTAHTLTDCRPFQARLLQGHVRFYLRDAVPDTLPSSHANDTPLPLAVALHLTPSADAAPHCETSIEKTVRYSVATRSQSHTRSVPLETTSDAISALIGTSNWADTGERHTRYSCAVPETGAGGVGSGGESNASAGWSGDVQLQPLGWAIGLSAVDYKVCRYSADLNASGHIDRNEEHPAHYTHVRGPLTQQNYLVLRGNQHCPSGPAPHNEATLQHQPPP